MACLKRSVPPIFKQKIGEDVGKRIYGQAFYYV